MTDEKAWQVFHLGAALDVTDLEEAAAFYEKLGFERRWQYPFKKTAEATHVGMQFDEARILLARVPEGQPIDRQNLYLTMENVQAYHAALEKRLAEAVPELEERNYRMKDFTITDSWGHRVSFGEEI